MEETLRHLNAHVWEIATDMTNSNIRNFRFETVQGLIDTSDNKITILMMVNDEPHNGSFLRFIEYLEQQSRAHHFKIQITKFMTEPLREWFLRRDYKLNNTTDTVTYQGAH